MWGGPFVMSLAWHIPVALGCAGPWFRIMFTIRASVCIHSLIVVTCNKHNNNKPGKTNNRCNNLRFSPKTPNLLSNNLKCLPNNLRFLFKTYKFFSKKLEVLAQMT